MTTFVRYSSTIAFGFKSMENMNIFQMFDFIFQCKVRAYIYE